MVLAKILSEKFIDVAGQKDIDGWIQKLLGRVSVIFTPVFPVDLSQTIITRLLIDAILLETTFGHDEGDDFQRIHSIFPGGMVDQSAIPQHFTFGKLILGDLLDHLGEIQNFLYAGVTRRFCEGEKFFHFNWKFNSEAPLGRRRNILQ